MVKSVQRGRIDRGVLPKSSWPWEDWLDVLWDRKQKLGLDLFQFLSEKKIQAALRRELKSGDQSEDKRFPRLAPVKYNPRLTKQYLGTTPKKVTALERELLECLLILHALRPRGILDPVIKVYPAEKTAAQLKTKIGRPTKYHRPMKAAERKRRQRGAAIFQSLLIPGRFPWTTLVLDTLPRAKRRKKAGVQLSGGKPPKGILDI